MNKKEFDEQCEIIAKYCLKRGLTTHDYENIYDIVVEKMTDEFWNYFDDSEEDIDPFSDIILSKIIKLMEMKK